MNGRVALKVCLYFITLSSFAFKGCFCFFLQHSSGRCIRSAIKPHLASQWAKIWYLELTNDCTLPEAQFRFRNEGVLQHVPSDGCVLPSSGKAQPAVGTKLVVFAAKDVCTNKSNQAYTHTSHGSLRHASSRCIQPRTSFLSIPPVGANLEYSAVCNTTLQQFILGSVTCEGNTMKDINCPASQVISITKANYGGYGAIKTCGYIRNYNCLLPSALCHVKGKCDGHQNCEINVTTSEFKDDACTGIPKYLYVEYQCVDRSDFKKENMKIKKVRLVSGSQPSEGYVEVQEDNESNVWQRLCMENMKNGEKGVVCRSLGYSGVDREQSSVRRNGTSVESQETAVLHGNVHCNSQERNISSCCLEKMASDEDICSTMPWVSCAICSEPVLGRKPQTAVVFTASGALPGYSADQAKMSSGSAWCARETADHLKIDLRDTYVITQLAMLGDNARGNWVKSYEVLYSRDQTNWLPGIAQAQNRLTGNSASDELSTIVFDIAIHARFIKVFPKSWQGYACLKVEICGHKLLPGAPTNLKLSSVTAYTAYLTWIMPADTGDGPFTSYQVRLLREGILDANYTTKSGAWHFATLKPYTDYTVLVQAGNEHGNGLATQLTFRTNSTAPTSPPLNVELSAIGSTSLLISWIPPPVIHRNGNMTGYEVCFSWVNSEENCERILRTKRNSIRLGYLSPASKYKVKILARNDAGPGNYSKEYFQITNAEPPVCNRSTITEEVFLIRLQKPRDEIKFCQVIVAALPSNENLPDNSIYLTDPMTFLEASGSPAPYIAGEFRASEFLQYQHFTVGDSKIYPALLTLNTKARPAKKYFNGPLMPNTRYTVFQRFFNEEELLYSSDVLAPVKTNGIKTTETSFQAHSASSTASFKVPFILMTIFFLILLFILASFLLLRWRRQRQRATGKTTAKTTQLSTTDEKIPMNDIQHNNNEQTDEIA